MSKSYVYIVNSLIQIKQNKTFHQAGAKYVLFFGLINKA
jgi:hypothetical protein